MKKIQMYIWDIPCKERKSNLTYGSLGFGETFVISSIQTENAKGRLYYFKYFFPDYIVFM